MRTFLDKENAQILREIINYEIIKLFPKTFFGELFFFFCEIWLINEYSFSRKS